MRCKIPLLLFVLLLAGCSAPAPTSPAMPSATSVPNSTETSPAASPTPSPEPTFTAAPLPEGQEITFDASGTKPLTGAAYGNGETAILLANMSIGGQKQWDPFVATVDQEKFTTVTFDYRNMNDPGEDIGLVLGWLRRQGFARVICIGASMGTRACSTIMSEPEIVGIALIAGAVHHASVAAASYPKLFLAGAQDVWAFDIQQGYEQAAEPKQLILYENERAHGTDLFRARESQQFLSALLEFVNDLA